MVLGISSLGCRGMLELYQQYKQRIKRRGALRGQESGRCLTPARDLLY